MRIALDAMGGDHGHQELVSGAVLACKEQNLQVTLVGDEGVLKSHLDSLQLSSSILARIEIAAASQVVTMGESPVESIRKKKDSSIMVAFDLHRRGEASAVVSAGNSGATMAAGVRKMGRIKGISRPGIASSFPTLKKPVVMMDVGANVDCRARHLYQFAVMATAFSHVFEIERPKVGILSIGEETGKGNSLVKETHAMLSESSLNFIGNVEGRDVFQGDVDVIVCDGFVGNICLKISEGLAESAMKMVKEEVVKSWAAKVGYLLARPAFKRFRKKVDYAEYGGAPLLGINGVGIICHGKSNACAIKNAVIEAAQMIDTGVNEKIVSYLSNNKVGMEVAS
ncbi:MAG: phosphate acyltransferase PlsX [Thermodesulfobacteriota bacterium]